MSDRLPQVRNSGLSPPKSPVSSRPRSPLEADGADARDNNGILASVVGREQLISDTSDLPVSLHCLNMYRLLTLLCPRRRGGALSDTAIRPSVSLSQPRLSARWLPAAGRPPDMCGLRTRPWTEVDPLQVKLPSAGHIVSPPPGR